MRYEMERARFQKLCGMAELLKTADLLAERGWFSHKHCLRRLRALPDGKRQYGVRLLRAAQWERERPGDRELAWLCEAIDRQVDSLKFFFAPLSAEIYRDRLQPIFCNGQKIGVTLKAERAGGNRVRVYYLSKSNAAYDFEKAVAKVSTTGSELLDSEGFRQHVTEFHVKPKKIDSRAA